MSPLSRVLFTIALSLGAGAAAAQTSVVSFSPEGTAKRVRQATAIGVTQGGARHVLQARIDHKVFLVNGPFQVAVFVETFKLVAANGERLLSCLRPGNQATRNVVNGICNLCGHV